MRNLFRAETLILEGGVVIMKIGELSKATGASIRSLRYYDNLNLLHATRGENGYREFDESAIARVKQIQLFLGLGLTTEQIAEILRCRDRNIAPVQEDLCDELVALYRKRMAEINKQIHHLMDVHSKLAEQVYRFEQRQKEHLLDRLTVEK
jgi:MerR family Zn(II)-responsive transcriptional regulator of zntA